MSEELKNKIEVLELQVETLTNKVNEVVSCLEDNELSRKVPVEYINTEAEELNEEVVEE